jgi:hypothetical protein
MDGKIEQHVCIKFCVKLSKSATGIVEIFREAFGDILLVEHRFLNGIHFSRPADCQLKMTNVQSDQAPAKRQKMLKTFEN